MSKIPLIPGGTPILAEGNTRTLHLLVHNAGYTNHLCLGQATIKLWTEKTSTTSWSQGSSLSHPQPALPLHRTGYLRLETRVLLQTPDLQRRSFLESIISGAKGLCKRAVWMLEGLCQGIC